MLAGRDGRRRPGDADSACWPLVVLASVDMDRAEREDH